MISKAYNFNILVKRTKGVAFNNIHVVMFKNIVIDNKVLEYVSQFNYLPYNLTYVDDETNKMNKFKKM